MKRNGFTLVETLVSLFILSVALTGAFSVITTNLNSANAIKNSYIASGLVQEGLEITRNLRDGDWQAVPPRPFGSFGHSERVNDGSYKVQYNSTQFGMSPATEPLFIDCMGLYNYDYRYDACNTPTLFYRYVTVTKIPSTDKEIQVVVRVEWNGRFGKQSVSAEEHFYDWY